jgi:hypothetical protein
VGDTHPERALVPLVVPVTVPPAAGRAMGLAHVPGGRVVVVVGPGGDVELELVDVVLVELVVVGMAAVVLVVDEDVVTRTCTVELLLVWFGSGVVPLTVPVFVTLGLPPFGTASRIATVAD